VPPRVLASEPKPCGGNNGLIRRYMLVTFEIWLFYNHMNYRTDSLVAWQFSSVMILLIVHRHLGETYLANVC